MELGDGKICGQRSLTAFFAYDADTNVGGLDHRHVIATVADASDSFLGMLSNEESDVCFLSGRATASDHGWQMDGGGNERETMVGEKVGEGVAINEKGGGGGVGVKEREGVCSSLGVGTGEKRELSNSLNMLRAGDKLGGDSNTPGGFDFVTRQHPDFDASVTEELERGLDVLLEFIFDACDPKKFEIMLEVLSNNVSHTGVAGFEGHRSFFVI